MKCRKNTPDCGLNTSVKTAVNKSVDSRTISDKKKCVTDNNEIDFSITPASSSVINSRPLGLINHGGDNVCFFNSVIQVLYSIIPVREYVCQMETNDLSTLAIKDLFTEITSSNKPIVTAKYIQRLGLTDYRFHNQYDAQECLLQLLGKIYRISLKDDVPDDCVFKLSTFNFQTGQIYNVECQTVHLSPLQWNTVLIVN